MSVRVSSLIWGRSKAKGPVMLLMLALADQANDEGVCWPGRHTIRQRLRLETANNVSKLIAKAVELGELEVITQNTARGQKANKYQIRLDVLRSYPSIWEDDAPPRPLLQTEGGTPTPNGGGPLLQTEGDPYSKRRGLINIIETSEETKETTPPNPQGGTEGGQSLAGHEDEKTKTPSFGEKQEPQAKGGSHKKAAVSEKGSGRGAGRRSAAPELPEADLRGLLEVYNANAGNLPKAEALNPGRIKALCRFWKDCGYDLENARNILANATKEVAADPFWTERRTFGLDTLLPKVWSKFEAWANRSSSPAPTAPAPRRRRDMTPAEATAAAAQNAASMLDYLED